MQISTGLLIVLLIGLLIGMPVQADSIRCGSKLVKTGDTKAKLEQRCGKPMSIDRGYESVTINGFITSKRVERWHYGTASGKYWKTVYLHNNEVIKVGNKPQD